MAEQSAQEKTEQPTPKRRQDAREKGEVARSRELNTVISILAVAAGLLLFGDRLLHQLIEQLRHSLQLDPGVLHRTDSILEASGLATQTAMIALAPLLLLMFVSALIGPAFMGGVMFRIEAVAPKLEKLDPIKGLGRIFSSNGLMELFKALAKFGLVVTATFLYMRFSLDELILLGLEPLIQALSHGAQLILWCLLLMGGVLVLVAVADVPFQLWQFTQKLRMTRQEVKDEMKETDGRPEVKNRIRNLRQEIAQRRMMEDVKTADVVVRNPTHYAVALKYSDDAMTAPLVVAKGRDLVALEIIEIAEANNVYVFTAPPLARTLYATTEISQEIPARLYLAVAQLLAYVYQLNNGDGSDEPLPPEVTVPQDLLDELNDAD